MVTAIFDLIAEAVTGLSVTVWNQSYSINPVLNQDLLIGIMLIGLGVGLVWTLIRFVTGLVGGVI